MALPKLNSITYDLNLPSTGNPVKFSPFLVKEQKALMIAQESEDNKLMENTFAQIINDCVFEDVDPYKMPMFDIEYLFLRIRGKSVGEKVKLNVLCPDDEKTRVPVEINLNDVSVQMTVGHTNEVNIGEQIKLYLNYPILSSMNLGADANESDMMFQILHGCVNEIHYNDKIYNRTDFNKKELEEFFEQFTMDQMGEVLDFFNTMPKLRHVVNIINPNTKVKSEVILEGLNTFLE